MNERATLTWTAVLGVFLFVVHWAQDVAFGIDRIGLYSYGGVALMTLWLTSATILRDGRAGKVILLLFSLLAAAMPALHLKGVRIAEIAKGEGGLLYLVVLLTLAVTAAFSALLTVRALRRPKQAAN
jgi:hypothetical protein